MKCIIFANCQGETIGKILGEHPAFSKQYEIKYICNFECIDKSAGLPMDEFAQADLLIFQPISIKHGEYCTDSIGNIIKSSCEPISFPYIYNAGVFAMYEEGRDIIGKEVIIRLMKESLAKDDIIKMLLAEAIDFDIRRRFDASMMRMRESELKCNMTGISNTISMFIKKRKIFITQNHVSNFILFEIVNRILLRMDFQTIKESDWGKERMDSPIWQVSPFESRALGYEYDAIDPGWFLYLKNCIERICTCDFEVKK
jgi:hypothetical protein